MTRNAAAARNRTVALLGRDDDDVVVGIVDFRTHCSDRTPLVDTQHASAFVAAFVQMRLPPPRLWSSSLSESSSECVSSSESLSPSSSSSLLRLLSQDSASFPTYSTVLEQHFYTYQCHFRSSWRGTSCWGHRRRRRHSCRDARSGRLRRRCAAFELRCLRASGRAAADDGADTAAAAAGASISNGVRCGGRHSTAAASPTRTGACCCCWWRQQWRAHSVQ